MHRLLYQHRHLSCDAGTRKPAGICDIRMSHLHADLIIHFPEKHLFADVIIKRNISVRTFSQIITVAPYLTVFINPVKQQPYLFSPVLLGQRKSYPVPADSARQISRTAGIAF